MQHFIPLALTLTFFASSAASSADKPEVIELWSGKVPDQPDGGGPEKVHMSPKLTKKEVEVTESTRLVTNVTRPTIHIYRPARDKDTGAAMIVCPGGGYWNLYWELEGEEVAAWLTQHGITGLILKYRVPRRPEEPKAEPARRPFQDAQRAVSLVRSRAREWGIDPSRIGMIGFSAGGHLVLATATNFEKRSYEPVDDIDRVSCRPDFVVAAYSGYLKAKDKDELALGIHVPKETPPVFLVHGDADIISPPEGSVLFYQALKNAGVPAELHIYAGASHDFAVRKVDHTCGMWPDRCLEWLRSQGFVSKKGEADADTSAGWKKYEKNPVLGGLDLGTCFDNSVLKEDKNYRMWFSWRPKKSIALVESGDGINWRKLEFRDFDSKTKIHYSPGLSQPEIVLGPNPKTDWESDINRPVVIKNGNRYQMWYTGQARGKSWIGYATSDDGKKWERMSDKPVLSAEAPWEKVAVMCPHVIYDEKEKFYRMWYSGGEQYEPNAIGYATSRDGLKWEKHPKNPIFTPDANSPWEKDRVTACQVIRQGDWYVMFYIGFRDRDHAQIGLARSKDGITGWERHPSNPIIRPGKNQWDHDAVYKPYAIFDGKQWLLWYNGRKGGVEQIGLATHEGEDLGF